MNTPEIITFTFPDQTVAEAGRLTDKLRDHLKEQIPYVETSIVQENKTHQDMGTTLAVALGTPSVLMLAKAIYAFCQRYGARVSITNNGREYVGIAGDDIATIEAAIAKSKKP